LRKSYLEVTQKKSLNLLMQFPGYQPDRVIQRFLKWILGYPQRIGVGPSLS